MSVIFLRKSLPYRTIENYSILHVGPHPIYLNEAGTRIWSLIDGHSTAQDIAQLFARHYNLPTDLAEKHGPKIESFLEDLYSKGLLLKSEKGVLKEYRTQNSISDLDRAVSPPVQPHQPKKESLRPIQEECMTAQTTKVARTLSEQFDKLYWSKYYIHKMHLELTYRCNFRCVHCYNPTHGGGRSEMTTSEWERTFDQLAGLGCYLLIFTGGELFVRKDAPQILQAASDKGFTFRLNTNGSLIDERTLEHFELMRPFLQSVDISFYGAMPEVHDVLARSPGSYSETLRAVRLLLEAKINVAAKFVTMRDNFDGIELFENNMREIGVPYVVSTGSLIPQTNRNTMPLVQLTTDKQYEKLLATRITQKNHENPGACRPGHVRGAITPDGYVSPCEWLTDFKLGNVREQALEEIWYGTGFQSFRKVFEQESECSSCELSTGCGRCPAHSYLETGNLLQCAPNQRHYAEIHHDYYAART